MTDHTTDKAMSLDQKREALWRAFDAAFQEDRQAEVAKGPDAWITEMYDDYVIVIENGDHFKVGYTMDGERKVEFAQKPWTPVKEIREWVERTNSMKAISKTDDELVVENYIVLFGGRDLEGIGSKKVNPDGSRGEYFTKNTDFESDYTKVGLLYEDWEHGQDPDEIGNDPDAVLGYVDWKTAQFDDVGVKVQRVLNRRHKYMTWLEKLIEAGVIGNSSEAVQNAVVKGNDGEIKRWPLYRDTLTVTPMEPRMITENVVSALKALNVELPETPEDNSGGKDGSKDRVDHRKSAGDQDEPEGAITGESKTITGESNMSDIQAILSSDLDTETKKALVEKVLDNQKAAAPVAAPVAEPPAEDAGENKAGAVLAEEPQAPVAGRPPYSKTPAYKFTPAAQAAEQETQEQKSFNVFYQSRFGDESAAQKAIMTDLLGTSYRQFLYDQDMAYAKFLRRGERALTDEDRKALGVQIFPIPSILKSVGEGISLAEIKATMVEAQGELGGYAVPPVRQENFIVRLRGTTAVRGGGAVVITLTNGNSTEIPVYEGGDDQYVGALRGEWGSETQNPNAQNAKMSLGTVTANIYTYKVPMSQSLIEDASNLVSLVQNDIVDTAAIDEDIAFLTGAGGSMPHGILPGGLNTYGISEVNSGAAAALTADGIISLSDGIADQYIDGSRFIFRRTTGTAIRQLKDLNNNYLFDRDLENNKRTLLGFPYFRTDSMPAVAANAYPILFGHLSAYYIVERMGMTIQRFQDSGTGPNKVEFHVRRRVGGRLSAPFKLAVQKVSA